MLGCATGQSSRFVSDPLLASPELTAALSQPFSLTVPPSGVINVTSAGTVQLCGPGQLVSSGALLFSVNPGRAPYSYEETVVALTRGFHVEVVANGSVSVVQTMSVRLWSQDGSAGNWVVMRDRAVLSLTAAGWRGVEASSPRQVVFDSLAFELGEGCRLEASLVPSIVRLAWCTLGGTVAIGEGSSVTHAAGHAVKYGSAAVVSGAGTVRVESSVPMAVAGSGTLAGV